MTKIYIYCLFEMDDFVGVYSSLKAVHRDALKLSNRGHSNVYMVHENKATKPSLSALRNIFKGNCDMSVKYRTTNTYVKIFKTRLRE